MKTDCYLVVRAIHGRFDRKAITGVKVVGVRAGMPSLNAGEIAVKVTLDIPPEAFDAASVAVVVEPRHVTLAAAVSGDETPCES